MIYEYECEEHGYFQVTKSMADYATEELCLTCGAPAEKIISMPEIINTSKPLPFGTLGHNVSRGTRTPQQQEKAYSTHIEETRKLVKQRARSLSRKPDGDIRMKGQIPRELHHARTKQFGKRYWEQEGIVALKRDGIAFE